MERNDSQVLNALYFFARKDIGANLKRLATLLGSSHANVERSLIRLDKLGLVRAETCRLSLAGLAVAHRQFKGQPARAPVAQLAA